MVFCADCGRLYPICETNWTKIHEKSSAIQTEIHYVCLQSVSSFCQRLYSTCGNINIYLLFFIILG